MQSQNYAKKVHPCILKWKTLSLPKSSLIISAFSNTKLSCKKRNMFMLIKHLHLMAQRESLPYGLPLPFLSKLFISFLIFLGMCQLLHPLHFSQTIRTFYHLRTCLYFPSTVELWQATWSSLCQLYVLVLLVYITVPLMPKYH